MSCELSTVAVTVELEIAEYRKKKAATYNRQYRATHKEQDKENRKKRLAENPDYEKDAMKQFNWNHPGRMAELRRNHYWRNHDKELKRMANYRVTKKQKLKKEESSNG